MNPTQSRRYYFGAGPATLPRSILEEAQLAILDWNGSGLSILEVGHRTDAFEALCKETEALCRALLGISDAYSVLFVTGPARLHFSMIPLNFIRKGQSAAYFISGTWSKLAYEEALRLSNVYFLDQVHLNILAKDTAYFYYTANETIEGIQYFDCPCQTDVPVVADMTSCLFTAPIDVSQYGLIFAGVQKNIAPAGMTLVIVKTAWLSEHLQSVPRWLDYSVHHATHSLYATPATFQYYMANRMFHWIQGQGGVSALSAENRKKSERLYAYLDESDIFYCPVPLELRSMVNVIIRMRSEAEELAFLAYAERQGLYGLAGHRTTGGIRASLYNAMPYEGVEALIETMTLFLQKG